MASKLNFRDDEIFAKLNKTSTSENIKEIPYQKNNFRVGAEMTVATTDDGNEMTHKQKMIADLKNRLLAPFIPPAPLKKNHTVDLSRTVKDMNQVMSWGTPRLVSKGGLAD